MAISLTRSMTKQKMAWHKLIKEIEEAKKDPEFLKALDEFMKYHTGKSIK